MLQEVDIDSIVVDRTTPVFPEDVATMAKDIKANGLQRPLIIDRVGNLIDGLLRLRALERLGVRKASVHVAGDLAEAIGLLRDLNFDPNSLDLRRRRDFAESLSFLLQEWGQIKLSNRGKNDSQGTRELVAEVLGYSWHRIRRAYRWIEEDPNDPERSAALEGLENKTISPHRIYVHLVGVTVTDPQSKNRVSRPALLGDISTPREQEHLLGEMSRQLSGVMKASKKLGLPLKIPADRFDPLYRELYRHRTELSKFLKKLRDGAPE